MDLIRWLGRAASPSVGDSPLFLLLFFSGFYWGPFWGFSLGSGVHLFTARIIAVSKNTALFRARQVFGVVPFVPRMQHGNRRGGGKAHLRFAQ